MRNRFIPLVAASAAVVLALTACGAAGSSGSADGGTAEVDRDATFRVAMSAMPPSLDPHTVDVFLGYPYVSPVYDRLTNVTPDLQLEPQLATGWEFAPDGMSAIFTLREGVTFSDGEVLDAAAVKASLDRALTLPASTVKNSLSMIASIDVVDTRTVRINTNRLAADLPFALAGAAGSIISPAALDNPDLDVNPVGSGPYVLGEFTGGDGVTYERREGYWDEDAQKSAAIEISTIGDGNARVNALRSGQVDMIRYNDPEHPQISNLGPGFTDYSYSAAGPTSVWFNSSRPHLSDGRVRQALNWAIDRDAINEALMAGQCAPSVQPLPEAYSGHLEEPPITYGHDPDKARELLRAAGVPDGFSFRLLTYSHGAWGNLATALQEQLAQVGITVQVDQLEASRVLPAFKAGDYDGFLAGRPGSPTGAMVLADNYLNPRYPGPLPEGFDAAVKRAFDPQLDEAAQAESTEEAAAIGNESALDLFICADSSKYAATDKVIGEENMGAAETYGLGDFRYVGVTR